MISAQRREQVRLRARERCEYCGLGEEHLPLWPFHLEHIIAEQHGGSDDVENLAWSCQRCNLRKGTNLAAVDPQSKTTVPLFHPRRDSWLDHFHLESNGSIHGRTSIGRATAGLLQMNAPERVEIRRLLVARGLW